MNAFLQEIGRKLADRWLTVLVLPGLLFSGAVMAAVVLGHTRALDAGRYIAELTGRVAKIQQGGGAGVWVLVPILALAACAAAYGARLVGGVIRRIWLGQWPRWTKPVMRLFVRRRVRRWQKAADEYAGAVKDFAETETLERLGAARNAIALAPPSRPSWIGDRVAATDARVLAGYELDLGSAWPRLWPILPDNLRADLRAAGMSFETATTLAGWSVLYLGVGTVWWPGALIGIACLASAVGRARGAAANLADLIEAAVDLHGPELAKALRLTEDAELLTPELGRKITRLLRKGA
ncbi:hypothetical protein [Amycolatopsis sp. NPDC102389]|uniref:hypothetical protein n=1 Tax=Amycolatopsis sp. NPDC102389 TaxID=3363941 RepID=UPI0038215F24